MRLGRYLSSITKPEIDILTDNCNFSKDESIIINMASTGSSDIQIAEKLKCSTSSITKKKKCIKNKIIEFLEVSSHMTTIYLNGKKVTKEELKNNEIHIEKVNKILLEKLTKND